MAIVYDKHYFEDDENGVPHPAGYSNYGLRWREFRIQNLDFIQAHDLAGKSVLELAGAFGFFLDAHSEASGNLFCTTIDGSEYAASQHPLVIHADALTYLQSLPDNAFEVIVGLRFLPCLSDEQLAEILPHVLRVAPQRIFTVDSLEFYQLEGHDIEKLEQYYNVKTVAEWEAMLPGCTIECMCHPRWLVR